MFARRRTAQSTSISNSGSHQSLGGGLTLRRHVQPREFNAIRLAEGPNTGVSSVFHDRRTAEIAISTAIEAHASRIAEWLQSWDSAYFIRVRADVQVGWVMRRGELSDLPAFAVRVLLLKTDQLPDGYRIYCATVAA